MKLINRVYSPVTVNYFGLFMPVPPDVKFLATDADGTLYGYIYRPLVSHLPSWSAGLRCPSFKLATVDLEGKDWRESLVTL